MKSLVYILGLAVLGIAAYQFLKKDDDDILDHPVINPTLQTQPQQKFPLQAIETPRVDNADQPWYGGARDFVNAADQALDIFDSMNSTGSMTYNSGSFWTELTSQYVH